MSEIKEVLDALGLSIYHSEILALLEQKETVGTAQTKIDELKKTELKNINDALDKLNGDENTEDSVRALIKSVKAELEVEEKEPVFPKAMTENAYENAKRLTIREISPKLCGFHTDTEEKTGHLDHFKNGWIGKKAGDSIHFEVTASCIAVQYRKTIQLPAARAELVLDGDKEKAILLDGNFDEDWGDCLYLEKVLHHGEKKIHTVDITILPEEVTDTTPFYLMSLIIA